MTAPGLPLRPRQGRTANPRRGVCAAQVAENFCSAELESSGFPPITAEATPNQDHRLPEPETLQDVDSPEGPPVRSPSDGRLPCP